MKFLFTILISSLCFSGFSQIVAPDTVCVGGTFGLTTSAQFATTYTWNFSPTNVNQTVSPFTSIFSGAPLNSPSTGCLVNDGGNYYFFVINYNSEDLIKFNYGTSLYNTPVITNMGNFGMTGSDLGGLDIVKDSATNNWYGLLADYSMMGVLSFGTSPNNVPTYTNTSYPYPTMGWGHHLKIKRYNGNWIAFLANRNANITRFDFGSSLTNPPTTHVLPNVGGMVNPVHFALYEEGGNWYALASNLIAATLIRYDFGPNLMNNAPTGVSLGNPGGYLTLPRGENIYNDCEGHVICYLGDEGGQLIKLDFGTSITSTPVATNLGPTGITHITNFSPYSHGDTMSMVIVDATYGSTGLLWLYTPYIYSTPAITNYYNPNLTYSFPAVGTYHVSLFCDQGFTSGPSVYCKDIVVINGTGTASSHDTTLCGSPPITLYADTVGRYTWSTGDTTFSILASASGTYWNTTFMSACNYKSDTTHVNFVTGISVNLGNDTAFCRGDSFMLAPVIPGGTSFTWSTGATSPSITIDSPGRYWIKVTSGGCVATDTIKVAVNPDPIVNLGPDQSECAGAPITLQPTGTYTSPTYLWNTGSTSATISPTTSGNYWLQVTVAGCIGADTVNVNFKPNPLVSLPSDTAICPGKTLNVGVAEPPGVQYLWSNGSTDSSITISDAGTYTLTVDLNGCKTTASINVTNGVLDSFSLGPDTTACKGDAVELSVNSNAAIWSNGKEGPSITVSFPGTYWVMVPEQCGLVSDTINVDFHICDIGFPSAFTPNGDGLNDVIGVVGTLKYYSNFSLSIYNRWGQRVFYTEDIYAGWDGIFNGTKQDLGTYFYMIYYSLEGKKHMMKGDFQLIR